ncbi:right-handed parallel beta-helix repeat-containing protein [archaeon]|nr:right-handed parallel beta-helix repeat-containing protein [archaeon]
MNKKVLGIIVFFFVLVSIYLIGSVTRTISDSQDNKNMLIRNSNGNYWEPTTANIQAAINDLEGGTVWLPEGTFIITQTIQLDDDINLVGMGKSTVIRLGDMAETDLLRINNADNVLIRDISFDGNEAGQSPPPHYGEMGLIVSGSSSHVTIENCYFKDIIASHIDVREGTKDVIIDSCHFEGRRKWSSDHAGYGGAIWISSQDAIVRNNFIKDTYACGIVFESATGSPPASGIVKENIITGEICHGIHMEGNGKSSDIIISGNYLYGLGSTAYNPTGENCFGINVAYGSIASNNIVDGVTPYASPSFGIIGTTGNVTIEGNIIKNVHHGIARYHDGKPSRVVGNSVENVIGYGIVCGNNVNNTVIIGNTVKNTGSVGILLTGSPQNCIISGNIVSNTGSHGIKASSSGSDYNVITNNICRGETIQTAGAHTITQNNIEG